VRFLGNAKPPHYHNQITAAVAGHKTVTEDFEVAGVPQRFVREWLARCWTYQGSPRVFSHPWDAN
jgi:hypothetical protein